MNGTQAIHQEPVGEVTLRRMAGGSIMESIGAMGAMILAVIGLAGILSSTLAAVATIVVGAAILIEGGTAGASYRHLVSQPGEGELQALELGGGVTAEFLGGLAGIVLGILALFGTGSVTLMAVAVLVFGAALLLSSAATSQLNWLAGSPPSPLAHRVAREAAGVATGGQVLTGLAAVVLGILAIIGLDPLTLVLVALLCLGASTLFSGSVIGGRMMSLTTPQ